MQLLAGILTLAFVDYIFRGNLPTENPITEAVVLIRHVQIFSMTSVLQLLRLA